MPVDSDLYARIAGALPGVPLYQVKLPDSYEVGAAPVLVLTPLSEAPEEMIDGTPTLSEMQCEVRIHGTDLAAARTVRTALRAALHNYSGGSIKRCAFTGTHDLYNADSGAYELPVEFTVQY